MTLNPAGSIMIRSVPNNAAPPQVGRTFQKGASTITENRSVTIWRERCLLWQEQDLERALAYFTFIADVTTLASDCRFAGDSETLVARYDGLPFAAIAFHSQGGLARHFDASRRIAALTRRLIAPTETFLCLVADEESALLQGSYSVLETHGEQQMLFRGEPWSLDPGDAVRLTTSDLPAMRALAQREGMAAFERDRNSASINNLVNRDTMEARRIGVRSTPSVFINGKLLKRRNLKNFQLRIDAELKNTP